MPTYTNWGAGIGQDIAEGILRTKKEHAEYDRMLGIADYLKRHAVDKSGNIVELNPDVKDKTLQPLFNQKAYDQFSNAHGQNRARAAGELKANIEAGQAIMRMQLQQAAREAAQPRTQEPAFPGGPVRDIPQTQAFSADIQKEAARQRALANVPKEQREARKEGREEGRYQKEMGQSEADRIKSAPEIKFFDKTGVPSSAFLRPQSVEAGYTAKERNTGRVLTDIDPLPPGKRLADYPTAPGGWGKVGRFLAMQPPTPGEVTGPIEYVPRPMIDPNTGQPMLDPQTQQPVIPAFRVKEYKYGGLPSKDKPESVKYAPHPEGEFLQIGDKRVPYEEAAQIRAVAATRRSEALQALQIHPELRPKIENRLQEWHYDLTDPFWKDLYKTGTIIYQ